MENVFVILKHVWDNVGERNYERQCYEIDYKENLNDVTKVIGIAKNVSGAIALLTNYVEPVESGFHRMKESRVCRDMHRRFLDYEFYNEDGKEKKRIRTTRLYVEERPYVLADCLW